ncbi:unnamed protein product, partial [Ectocarpus sp. 12 AP-2014]
MALRIVGQHKGSITLDLDNATVLDLKKSIAAASGLAASGLKLLAGKDMMRRNKESGKHLKDDAGKLAQFGITPGKTIMVLRQDLSEQVEAEAGLTRRTEEAVQAASLLSARAARDMGSGGRGNAWGAWGRDDGRGGGGGGGGGGGRSGGRGGRGRGGNRPEIELTNQDGEAMAIPPDDSAALMEGMMLHRQGLACLRRARNTTPSRRSPGAAAAAAAAASAAMGDGHAPPVAAERAPAGVQNKKARRRPQTGPEAAAKAATGAREEGALSLKPPPDRGGGSGRPGGWEERKESEGRSATQQKQQQQQGMAERKGKGESSPPRAGLVGRATAKEQLPERTGAREESTGNAGFTGSPAPKGTAAAPGSPTTDALPSFGEDSGGVASVGDGDAMEVDSDGNDQAGKGSGGSSGGGGGSSGTVRGPRGAAPTLTAAEKLMAQREGLGLLMRADEAFRRCDPKYLEAVDNYAYLCLDIVWLLFLMKDMKNIDLASRMLATVEKGFRKAHGEGLQRLTALKGEHCAEKLLYVRLHLLQGVVAFLRGDSGKASALLLRASGEAKALKPNPALACRLMQKWHTVRLEVLQPKVALQALRAGRNNIDAAWQYLENLRQRKETVRKERKLRMERRRASRLGMTADKKSYVSESLVQQLAGMGFPKTKAIRALRLHNNDVAAALTTLTTGDSSSINGGISSNTDDNNNEALAVLHSMGVPPEAARDVLGRTGTLRDALNELGLEAPEGAAAGVGGSGGGGGGLAGDDAAASRVGVTTTTMTTIARPTVVAVAERKGWTRSRRRRRRGCSRSWPRTGRTRTTRATWTSRWRTRATRRT